MDGNVNILYWKDLNTKEKNEDNQDINTKENNEDEVDKDMIIDDDKLGKGEIILKNIAKNLYLTLDANNFWLDQATLNLKYVLETRNHWLSFLISIGNTGRSAFGSKLDLKNISRKIVTWLWMPITSDWIKLQKN